MKRKDNGIIAVRIDAAESIDKAFTNLFAGPLL
jgi:hypothetical protein